MIPTIVIISVIAIYSAYVLRKKIKDIKNKKFCSCGCESCPSKNKCH